MDSASHFATLAIGVVVDLVGLVQQDMGKFMGQVLTAAASSRRSATVTTFVKNDVTIGRVKVSTLDREAVSGPPSQRKGSPSASRPLPGQELRADRLGDLAFAVGLASSKDVFDLEASKDASFRNRPPLSSSHVRGKTRARAHLCGRTVRVLARYETRRRGQDRPSLASWPAERATSVLRAVAVKLAGEV